MNLAHTSLASKSSSRFVASLARFFFLFGSFSLVLLYFSFRYLFSLSPAASSSFSVFITSFFIVFE